MLPLERYRRLLELLHEHGGLTTAQLAADLGVTRETVRRDLEKLEVDGALLRTHGGAVRLESAKREHPVAERAKVRVSEKKAIAQAALSLVRSGETVFFDPSTTVQALASLLPDQPLTVVTNSLQIPFLLADRPSIRTVLLGGLIGRSSLSGTGVVAERAADFFRIDAAFMSCRGIDARRGLSEATEAQAHLKRRIVERAERFYLLADATKAGVASSYFFADVAEVGRWITDKKPAGNLARAFSVRRVPVEIAKRSR